jgi:hypothetical protein
MQDIGQLTYLGFDLGMLAPMTSHSTRRDERVRLQGIASDCSGPKRYAG